jgi:hypothetical protein
MVVMKKFTVLETSIMGIFIGVIVASYLTFETTTGGFVGNLIGWISLQPVINLFNLPQNSQLVISFIFFVIVYTVYGIIFGMLIKKTDKSIAIAATLLLTVAATGTEQILGSKINVGVPENGFEQTASVISAFARPASSTIAQNQQQYFSGLEADGDLNGDGANDVAFIIPRNDPQLGSLYYLAAAIATSTGHIGTNLLFLGDKIKPAAITIGDGVIEIDYIKGTSTTTKKMYADFENGTLRWITASSSVTTTVSPVM